MPRRGRKLRGGDDGWLDNAALIGVGAYAARNSDGSVGGIIANVGTYALYFVAGIFILVIGLFLFAILFGKRTTGPAAAVPAVKEKMTQACPSGDVAEARDGRLGCRRPEGTWYSTPSD